jgi:hypothetical protein
MWLQRVIFNLQMRLLVKRKNALPTNKPSQSPQERQQAKRVQALQNRLEDLDERMSELQS